MNKIKRFFALMITATIIIQSAVIPAYAAGLYKATPTGVPNDAKEFGGHFYKVFNRSTKWDNAKKMCEKEGGHLAVVTTAQEQEFISKILIDNKTDSVFIGGCKRANHWRWVTKEKFSYSNWSYSEPSDKAEYICINSTNAAGSWFGTDSSYSAGYICEWDGLLLRYSGYDAQNDYVFRTQRFNYSDSYFLSSAYTYNHDLAKISLGLSFCAFTSKGFDGASNIRNAFGQMRFKKNSIQTYKYNISLNNGDSSAAHAFACKQLPDGSTLIAVAVRGGYYGCEWADNFSLGASDCHEGFYAAANEIIGHLKEYRQRYGIGSNIKYWVAGYSRGGAVANLVAAALDDETDCNNVFAYTFATPRNINTKSFPHAESSIFANIFNICFEADAIPQLVMKSWDYNMYGTTIYISDNLNTTDTKRVNSCFYAVTNERMDFNMFQGQSETVEDLADDIADIFVSPKNYTEKYQDMIKDFVYLYTCELDREYDSIAEKYIAVYGNDDDFVTAVNDLKSDFIVSALLNSIDSEYNLAEYAQVLIAFGIKNGRSYSEIKADLPEIKLIIAYNKFKDIDTFTIKQAHRPEVYLSLMLGMNL